MKIKALFSVFVVAGRRRLFRVIAVRISLCEFFYKKSASEVSNTQCKIQGKYHSIN